MANRILSRAVSFALAALACLVAHNTRGPDPNEAKRLKRLAISDQNQPTCARLPDEVRARTTKQFSHRHSAIAADGRLKLSARQCPCQISRLKETLAMTLCKEVANGLLAEALREQPLPMDR